MLTEDIQNKIKVIDSFINSLSVEDIKSFAEADLVASKLAGTNANNQQGLFSGMINENIMLRGEISVLRSEVMLLRASMQQLTRVLSSPYTLGASSDFQGVKSTLGVY